MNLFARSALSAAFALCGASALAQTSPPKTIGLGDTITGTLEKAEYDKTFEWIMDLWDFRATKGQRVTITLKSNSFDAYIDLDKGEEHVDSDDDSGGGTDAKLVLDIEETGTYRINVTSTDHDETGGYTLKVERGGELAVPAQTTTPRAARDAPRPAPIRLGQTLQGRISPLSPLHEDDTPYQPYSFTGQRGQKVVIDMKSEAFDSYLVLRKGGRELETDDDSGGGQNARLTYTLPDVGEYEIRANAVAADAEGVFSLSLTESVGAAAAARQAKPTTPVVPTTIAIGQTLRGELKEGDATADDGTLYDLYRFKGQARQKVVVTLRSDDFDAYVSIGTGGKDDDLAMNDDGPDGTDAEVTFTLPRDGEYDIRANTVGDDEKGRYVIGVSIAPR